VKIVCRREAVQEPPPCDNPLSRAKAIVDIIRRRTLSTAPESNGEWAFAVLNSPTPIFAEELDAHIHSMFSRITFEDWLALCYGLPNDPIRSLLNTVYSFRKDLSITAKVDTLQLLQKASLYSLCELPLT